MYDSERGTSWRDSISSAFFVIFIQSEFGRRQPKNVRGQNVCLYLSSERQKPRDGDGDEKRDKLKIETEDTTIWGGWVYVWDATFTHRRKEGWRTTDRRRRPVADQPTWNPITESTRRGVVVEELKGSRRRRRWSRFAVISWVFTAASACLLVVVLVDWGSYT